jgi:UDPglucose--hexose-1-phosphate uridylyltransferase
LVVDVWAERTRVLGNTAGIEQVFCFENRGAEIGVTEPHPHGQIYGYPFVTPRTAKMISQVKRYQDRFGRNLFDVVLDSELHGPRCVIKSSHWSAFVPFAARWPFEVHLYPLRRVPDMASLDDAQRDDLATVYLDLLGRFDRLFGMPAPYVAAWHQAPVSAPRDGYALHLELFTSRRAPDKLKYLAGSESAMDVFVGDIIPEQAAERLRGLG